MSDRISEATPLNDKETRELQGLLVQYLAYDSDGASSDTLVHLMKRVRSTPARTASARPEPPKSRKRKRSH